MTPFILDNVKFEPDVPSLIEKLRIDPAGPDAESFARLADEAAAAARPKALYRLAFIDDRGDDFIIVDGVRLSSTVLAINTAAVHRVFPYVATCGMEMEEWSHGVGDMLLSYYADVLKEAALRCAADALLRHMREAFDLGSLSTMNPGSLKDWPIQEQRPLFSILGDPEKAVGVRLTDSFLMFPVKSISGIRFTADTEFINCSLCPRTVCSGRRAPYDPETHRAGYAMK